MASGVERGRTRLQLVWISPRVGERDGKKQEAAMLVYGACRVRFFAWAFGGWRRGLSGLALHWGASVLTQCRDRLQRLYRDRDRISFRRNGPSQVRASSLFAKPVEARHNARPIHSDGRASGSDAIFRAARRVRGDARGVSAAA